MSMDQDQKPKFDELTNTPMDTPVYPKQPELLAKFLEKAKSRGAKYDRDLTCFKAARADKDPKTVTLKRKSPLYSKWREDDISYLRAYTDTALDLFLDNLKLHGVVTKAAADSSLSYPAIKNIADSSPRFREAIQLCKLHAMGRLEAEAVKRAVDGEEVPIFSKGEIVGTRMQKSDRLLEFLLERLHRQKYGRYNEEVEKAPVQVVINQFSNEQHKQSVIDISPETQKLKYPDPSKQKQEITLDENNTSISVETPFLSDASVELSRTRRNESGSGLAP